MKRRYPAERSRRQHQRSSRAFRFGDFRPGCLIFWLIVFTFASTAPIYADSSTPAEDLLKDEVIFGGQTLQGRILRLRPNGIEFEPIYAKGNLTIQYEKDDWLFRSFLDFTVPLFEPIALKLLLANVNGDNPSPDVGNNKFTTTMALSLEF
jgi:hypothetical protein